MNKKLYIIILLIICSFFVFACEKKAPHVHTESDWQYDGTYTCGDEATLIKVCTECGEILDMKFETIKHEYVSEVIEATCTEDGETITRCERCGYQRSQKIYATGHETGSYTIKTKATSTTSSVITISNFRPTPTFCSFWISSVIVCKFSN